MSKNWSTQNNNFIAPSVCAFICVGHAILAKMQSSCIPALYFDLPIRNILWKMLSFWSCGMDHYKFDIILTLLALLTIQKIARS